jgi:hypothetical protein
MQHYMDATGDDVNVNVDDLLTTPEMADSVDTTLAEVKARALEMCDTTCTYSFDSGWIAASFEQDISEREFFGYRGMTYQVTGSITVSRNARGVPSISFSGDYTVTAYKSWNFDRNEKLKGVPFSGPADAAGYGLAHEFAVVGVSTTQML